MANLTWAGLVMGLVRWGFGLLLIWRGKGCRKTGGKTGWEGDDDMHIDGYWLYVHEGCCL